MWRIVLKDRLIRQTLEQNSNWISTPEESLFMLLEGKEEDP